MKKLAIKTTLVPLMYALLTGTCLAEIASPQSSPVRGRQKRTSLDQRQAKPVQRGRQIGTTKTKPTKRININPKKLVRTRQIDTQPTVTQKRVKKYTSSRKKSSCCNNKRTRFGCCNKQSRRRM